ncbi:CoA transferase [Dietzia psychralcaliphila]|uniref:CoA transferase n=1 Tax=Dietzia psychralcaliphila TaxID=139021 RepID=UPI001C1E2F4F|nr:CoA transferase [Dietzia psychralcaliphila]
MDHNAQLSWATSGAMWLTGRRNGPPLAAPGRPAAHVEDHLRLFSAEVQLWNPAPVVQPDGRVLGERAAIAGLGRQGPTSCGGAFRTVRTTSGWIGLSLSRPSDLEFVPALTGIENDDPWSAVSRWAQHVDNAEADERIALLELPGCSVPEQGSDVSDRQAVVVNRGARRSRVTETPLVVDFSSMWAGPLCAHLLGLAGSVVVKVESTHRPDGARFGPRAFYDLLHAGHRSLCVDPADARHRAALRDLISRADIVLESSRPEALARWDLDADAVVNEGTSWLSITARGRASRRVGFGDDIAVGAGLYVMDGDEILPCGDALGDPLTGVVAAHAAARALADDHAQLVDVSMHDVCAEAAATPTSPGVVEFDPGRDCWWLTTDTGRVEVARPRPRSAAGIAAASGAHNAGIVP